MLILQAFFLWSMVSLLVIGGAIGFRRLFPEESPWFGFLVPGLALVVVLNFIEHFVAVPSLLFLAPILLGGAVWSMFSTRFSREGLLLPSIVFLASFAFAFGVRCLQPDISFTSDGLADLNKINNYCQGDTLPPIDTWLPPYHYEWYYSLQHYAASVVKRLFDLRLGVGYNVTHALLSAFICVAGAAAAHRISGGRTWVTLAAPFMLEAAATGSSLYIFLTMKNPSIWLSADLSGAFGDLPNNNPDNPIWKLLASNHHETLRLQVPGFWTWRDEYHANASGQFLVLFSVFVIAELVYLRRTMWPWIMSALIPVLAVTSSMWAFPMTFMLGCGTVATAVIRGRRPAQLHLMLTILGASLVLLWPVFYNVTSSPQAPPIMWTDPLWRAPFWEFVIQWWPILILWIYAAFCFEELSFGLLWVMLVVPVMLIGMEFITIEGRYNTIEKMWGYTYGLALYALFPFVAVRRNAFARLITILLLLSAAVSMFGWLRNVYTWLPGKGDTNPVCFKLEGDHYLRVDEQKKRILEVMRQFKHTTFLTGKSIDFNYYESPAVQVFTENRSFSTWTYFESVANYEDVAKSREKLNNAFYDGTLPNRLEFLQSNNISGVIIWPDNGIADDALATLTKELEPSYQYIDCKEGGDKNAGVFILRVAPSRPTAHL